MLQVGIQYNTELQRITRTVKRSIDKVLLPAIEAEKPNYIADDAWPDRIQVLIDQLKDIWSSREFNQRADAIARTFVRSSVSYVDKQNNRRFGIDVYGNSEQISDYMSAASIQNANLIKSIPERYLENVGNTVQAGMRNGLLPIEITKQLQDDYGVTQRRARFIARDQTAKINGEVNEQRQLDAGFEYFQWLDSDDERVRHRHREIADRETEYGKGIYRWDDLPNGNEGTPIKPSQSYNCRCTAKPVPTSRVEKHLKQKAEK